MDEIEAILIGKDINESYTMNWAFEGWRGRNFNEVVKIGCDKGFKPIILRWKSSFIGNDRY